MAVNCKENEEGIQGFVFSVTGVFSFFVGGGSAGGYFDAACLFPVGDGAFSADGGKAFVTGAGEAEG